MHNRKIISMKQILMTGVGAYLPEKILTNELTNKEFPNFIRDFLFKNKEIYPDW